MYRSQDADPYISRRVGFRFAGSQLELALSQSLFSSFDVDLGSRLLLATIAKHVDGASVSRVADIGCGTGVLGLATASAWGCGVRLYDRDALALSVAAMNAAKAGVVAELRGGLGCRDLAGAQADGGFDLVVCNLPAKSGGPVRAALLADCASLVAASGTLAIVVVAPLADETHRVLAALATINYRVAGPDHVVLGAQPITPAPPSELGSYQRRTGLVTVGDQTFELTTTYGLPDFDTPSHLTTTLAALFSGSPRAEWQTVHRLLVWNPGQGDLTTWLLSQLGSANDRPDIVLASRDALQLHASEQNLVARGYVPTWVVHASSCIASVDALGVSGATPVDLALVSVDDDSVRAHGQQLLPALALLVGEHGRLAIGGRGTLLSPLLQRRHGLRLIKQLRRKGQLAALLARI